ncbi:eukaryotic translation initiation factor [Theileria orientalis strain Shintoku]|uniref:Eukaryotic translation initiation factor 3 subunit B n=1 Tax=Theileria orientalis strain Shintoku TaxID=869250 RepID=J4C9B8_THEOR|nr:eukaryotic translation initiation factor [Theileria orientalis strain Shintoku]BAM42263.1 eukaryotic translation initiation factor [Theileria orientalis strain Shintoku]|eukprot:XP_009692564.1 eukaryotic translation initiation factor [Theileria orientalis strain Shintoku]
MGLMDFLSDDDEEFDNSQLERFYENDPPVTLDTSFPRTLIVLGLPVVGPEKYERLKDVVRKTISKELEKKGCEIQTPFVLEIPTDMNNHTKGLAFFTFGTPFEANMAQKFINKFKLDSSHAFKAIMLDNYDMIVSDDNKCIPTLKSFGFTRDGVRDWWMKGDRMRDQYVVRHGDRTEVFWFDALEREPRLAYDGARERAQGRRVWADQKVEWSPNGSYLAVYKWMGIVLYGGNEFEPKIRFEHKNVKFIQFSPCEEYLLTWDGMKGEDRHDRSICIWRVVTGELLRSFPTPLKSPKGGDFPHLLWNHNGKYIAMLNKYSEGSEVLVYKLPEMRLIEGPDGKPAPLKYAAEKFDWSPQDDILSVVIPGSMDAPARLILIEIPSRRELSSRNVYNVCEVAMHWHSKGDCLCLRTTISKKTGKKGRKQFNQLEIFRLRERNIPVDTIQIEDATVKQLHWEEGGSKRFALIVKDEESRTHSIRFYKVLDVGSNRDTVWTSTFDITSQLNHMQWSPAGNYFVLGGLGAEGTLLFCTLNDYDKVDVLHKDEHFMMNTIRWSSCGRYLATCVNVPMPQHSATTSDTFRYAAESGYCLWTFQGRLLHKEKKENFYSCDFRPHPTPLVTRKEIEKIRKNLKEYTKKYDIIDEKERTDYRNSYLQKRQQNLDAFKQKYSALMQWYTSQDNYLKFKTAWEIFHNPMEWEVSEEVHEEVVELKEEVLE